ncbi:FtsX-like permease family protein [Streptomyces sp. NPDC052396]|uniref:FtsX-like permease family protein n=1 Tax=Streptomyces sp. NPDC052396 TaxID=3365689 RepID=UPI0037CE1A73
MSAPKTHPTGPTGPAAWLRDMTLGARFAVTGGREGWLRTALTALGVGLGVALLMIAASVPHMMNTRDQRGMARTVGTFWGPVDAMATVPRGSDTLLYARTDTDFHDKPVRGALLRPDGSQAPVPPGLRALPGPGEMVVSPALDRLLKSDQGKLLRERLDYRTVGTVGKSGLIGPSELLYYAGSDRITLETGAKRIDHFGHQSTDPPMSPVLIVLLVMVCVVLLLPVGVFIATAVRFGGERRDRRLAALRLTGADSRMIRRIAAGEALCGAVLGLTVGAVLFLLLRRFAEDFTIRDASVFPSDIIPAPWLTALIGCAVPACAIVVTQLALRGITVEPLGVVRETVAGPRRLWWRLLLPAAGIGLLAPLFGKASDNPGGSRLNTYQIAGGAVLLLMGITAILPWAVEALVARFRGGPLPLQLAARRLQLSSGPAARAVSGITVAVAGAIAVQMLFAGVRGDFEKQSEVPAGHSQLTASRIGATTATLRGYLDQLRRTPDVRNATGFLELTLDKVEADSETINTVVGDCTVLRTLARLSSCRDGDVFLARTPDPHDTPYAAPPGTELAAKGLPSWTVPASARTVHTLPDASGLHHGGILATPSALDVSRVPTARLDLTVKVVPHSPDAIERARNTIARVDPTTSTFRLGEVKKDADYAAIERGLLIGSVGTLTLIGTSMLLSTLEQLRERRRLLSVLVAFGTRRTTLAWSVLWQSAIPVALGMSVAVLGGTALGWVMLQLVSGKVYDWWAFLPMIGAGAGAITLVTLLSLPPLWRLMRADGLRTE